MLIWCHTGRAGKRSTAPRGSGRRPLRGAVLLGAVAWWGGEVGDRGAIAADPVVVERVGPPSWWVDPAEQQVTLLIEGTGLEGATVRFLDGPVRVDRVEAQAGGRAVFVDATIPARARPRAGCRLAVVAGGQTIERRWDLVARPTRAAATVTPDDVLYLIMPDRFADGDPANNEPEAVDPPMYNRRDTHAYHGGDFAGVQARLPYLSDLGVTAIWLTPIYRQAPRWFAPRGAPRRYTDFHGYSPVDFYDTNPRFGSPAEYKALVDAAHRVGIKVVQDHLLGATGPLHPWATHPPTPDWFNGPIDHPPSCSFRMTSATDPHATEAERRGLTDGWFAGFLPDLDLRQPRPKTYAIQQSLWWATLFEADGIRLDTYPMVVRSFWPEWSRRLQAARPGIGAIGEAWAVEPVDTAFFQGGRTGWDGIDPGVASVFDFPLHAAINKVFAGISPMSDLASSLGRDGAYPRPDLLTTMLDNHDTARLAAVPGVTPARLRLAIAFLLTTRGTPQLTYGDEVGLVGHMDDRRDFPGGFPDDPRDAFTAAGRTPDEQATFATYRDLIRVRTATPALRRGTLTSLVATKSTYVCRRELDDQTAIVALNLGDQAAQVELPAELAGALPERPYGSARWTSTPTGPLLELPPESATIFRRTGP